MSNKKSDKKKLKILVIVGTTASGKTGLAVRLAKKFNGEIISADSRQVYEGMDIGTGKDLEDYNIRKGKKVMKIPHHLIDIVDPNEKFDLAKWIKLANIAIEDIISRNKLPIIAGGTGLYAQALVEGFQLSEIGPDNKLRKDLEEKNAEELFYLLEKINKNFAKRLNNSERNNKRRLIRYIEVLKENNQKIKKKKNSKYEFVILGVTYPREELKERIYNRLIDRLEKQDMINEVKNLRKQGITWKRLEEFGLEYRFIAKYLQNKITYEEMVERLDIAIRQFAKRQMTWLKRWEKQGASINWIRNNKDAEKFV